MIAAVERLQPFNQRRSTPSRMQHPLLVLHSLWNWDKQLEQRVELRRCQVEEAERDDVVGIALVAQVVIPHQLLGLPLRLPGRAKRREGSGVSHRSVNSHIMVTSPVRLRRQYGSAAVLSRPGARHAGPCPLLGFSRPGRRMAGVPPVVNSPRR